MPDSNQAVVAALDIKKPNLTWEQVVKFYQDIGFKGDDLYREIIKASQRSNRAVNQELRITKK